MQVAVVGAGAAGLAAAIAAGETGARVLLYNARPRIGLKILMSGGTRCNLTHDVVGAESYWGGSRSSVRMVLDAFPASAARRWFEDLGVAIKVEPGGKVFPASDSAETVLDALRRRAEAVGVEILAGAKVTGITHEAHEDLTTLKEPRFLVTSERGTCAAGAVVLTTGGLSYPKTGSDGSGFDLARSLGHTVNELTPALTPLVLGGDLHRRLQGVTVPAALTLRLDGRRVVTSAGSLLFTHFGLSGPAALDMSRHWLRAPPESRRTVSAHLLPGDPATAERRGGLPDVPVLEREWIEAARLDPRVTVQSHFGTRLPVSIVKELAVEAGIDHALALAKARREERRRFLAAVIELPLAVEGTRGYARAEVTAGGVPLEEVDPRRMASRRCADLFLAGEILDVDGRLGGYNFQWAWSSGRVAGKSAAAATGGDRLQP